MDLSSFIRDRMVSTVVPASSVNRHEGALQRLNRSVCKL